jgi:sphinganine-1-phosphate aldolase
LFQDCADAAERVGSTAYRLFALSNQMHPSVFAVARKAEAEVVSMTANLFNCPVSCGAVTSGGTESILMAVRAHKVYAVKMRGISGRPNLVCPETCHAAFDKACDYFDIEMRKVAVDPKTRRAIPVAMKRQIDRNSIAVVGSAVAFPHGTMDDIQELARIAKRARVGMHVDCCLGSFLIPFANMIDGVNLPPFDFLVDGVTSLSTDPHKYGLARKSCICCFLMYFITHGQPPWY